MVPLVLNGMPSRSDRWLRALDPGFAPVDGRTPEELLGFAAEVTRLYKYFNLQNREDGDWQPFFTSDAETVRTLVLAADPRPLTRRLSAVGDHVRGSRSPERKLSILRGGLDEVLRVARSLDRLLAGLLPGPPERSARTLLADTLGGALAGSLAPHLRELKSIALAASRAGAGSTALFNDAGLLPFWGLSEVYPDPTVARGAGPSERADAAATKLDAPLLAFAQGLTELAAAVRALPSAPPAGGQAPQMALYTAIVRLFRHAQDTVNTFSRRYVDFYYRRVLRESPRGPAPDSAYVTFTLAEDSGTTSSLVAKGTQLSAGEDAEGHTIVFATDKALRATSARIAAIRTLRVLRGPLFAPPPGELGLASPTLAIRGVLASDIDRPAEITGLTSFATFGPTALGVTAVETTVPATLGFAVACRCLHLGSGDRFVWLHIHGSDPALGAQLLEISVATGLSEAEVLSQVTTAAFRLQGSTAAGWLALDPYTASATVGESFSLALNLHLPPTAPAIEPLGPVEPADDAEDPEAAARDAVDPSPDLPTIKAYLRADPVALSGPRGTVLVAPISLLSGFDVDEITVGVCVGDLSSISVANTDGPVDTSAPFPMFGGTVNRGSSLFLQSAELFEKRLLTLSVTLEWSGLPPNDTGFLGYYRDYTLGLDGEPQLVPPLFDNRTFKVDVRVTNPGVWKVEKTSDFLFRTRDGAIPPSPCGALAPTTPFLGLPVEPNREPRYYDPATGAIRITLQDPPYAFGEDLYSINVLQSVLEDIPICPPVPPSDSPPPAAPAATTDSNDGARATTRDAADPPMCRCPPTSDRLKYPNPPWTPMLARVIVDYSASEVVYASAIPGPQAGFFHLLPWSGVVQVAPVVPAPPLLPRFAYSGNLLLGFEALPTPEVLTLLFRMEPLPDTGDLPMPPVAWELLSAKGCLLGPKAVLGDGTRGLTQTGILALSLPAADTQVGARMPGPYAWLRAGVSPGGKVPVEDRFPRTVDVYPNAVLSTWQPQEDNGAHLGAPVPAHSITTALVDLPDIETIDQPMASFGGRPAEDDRAFFIRLGERLRHKDRAILSWDHERIVFEAFPVIHQVAALPCRSPSGGARPGHVLVVALPGPAGGESQDPTAPACTGDLLVRIEERLRRAASPFVKIRAVSPTYVRIGVTASVEFREDDDPGEATKRLDADLVVYLSPWSDSPEKAARGADYASEDAIVDFIATRPYVAAIAAVSFQYSPPREDLEWYYLTSAKGHHITDATADTPDRPCGY